MRISDGIAGRAPAGGRGRGRGRDGPLRIGYETTDEVNQELAGELARQCGAVVLRLRPDGAPASGTIDAILIDLDDIPRYRRPTLLGELVSGHPTCPKAVHGYDLEQDLASTLQMSGVAVAQHLQIHLLHTLCRSVRRDQAFVPPDDALTDETWF